MGKIVKLGPGADKSTVKVGDRVGIKWVAGTCGSCRKFDGAPITLFDESPDGMNSSLS